MMTSLTPAATTPLRVRITVLYQHNPPSLRTLAKDQLNSPPPLDHVVSELLFFFKHWNIAIPMNTVDAFQNSRNYMLNGYYQIALDHIAKGTDLLKGQQDQHNLYAAFVAMRAVCRFMLTKYDEALWDFSSLIASPCVGCNLPLYIVTWAFCLRARIRLLQPEPELEAINYDCSCLENLGKLNFWSQIECFILRGILFSFQNNEVQSREAFLKAYRLMEPFDHYLKEQINALL